MRGALAILLLLLSVPARAQGLVGGLTGGTDPAAFSAQLAASVFTAAIAFIVPRALDQNSAQQLAMWGLGAPAALDDTLSTELRAGTVLLLRNRQALFERPAPPRSDAANWGTLVADLLATAADSSATVRAAGQAGIVRAFFDELFNHLDPYSRYLAPAAAGPDRARRSGAAGAGIAIRRQGGAFLVTDVNADGPGAAAGLRVGDRILAVDGQPTIGETLDTVQSWIGGVEGTDLSLTVRGRTGPPRTVELERIVLPPETVFASRSGPLLVLRISSFSADTADRFNRELRRALSGPGAGAIRGVVLDLRGNRGGLLRQAVSASNDLLDSGIIATTAGRDPQSEHLWRAENGNLAAGKPLVVLVDGRTASAAEIMAAALADNGRAVVVGSATLGKGLVQTIATLPDGGELFVSWSRVLAPAGWPLQGLGVLPQLCTSLGPEQTREQQTQLDRGTQPMDDALLRHRNARAPIPPAALLQLRAACPAAEGTEDDMTAARWLVAHPRAYDAARLTPPPASPQ